MGRPTGGERPAALLEPRPQPGFQRHTLEYAIEVCPFVQILDVPVPQVEDLVLDFLQKIDAPALDQQVITVPKISLDRIPQRSACRRPRRVFAAADCRADHRHCSSSGSWRSWWRGREVHKLYARLRRLVPSPWRLTTTSLRWSRIRRRRWRRVQRLALQLAFGLCGSARGSSSTGWGGQGLCYPFWCDLKFEPSGRHVVAWRPRRRSSEAAS